MPSHDKPWYRTPAAIFTAGGLGLALVAALVVTVVQLSDDWSQPVSTIPTPLMTQAPGTAAASTTPPSPVDLVSSYPSSTFTTSVQISTTDINGPSTPSSTDISGSVTSAPSTPGSPPSGSSRTTTGSPSDGNPASPTKRKPRFNETRTLGPSY